MLCDKLERFIKSTNSERFYFSPLNTILALIIMFPILMMNHGVENPRLFLDVFLFVIAFQFLLLFLKFLCIKNYKRFFSSIKSSLPKFNLFHFIMFIVIGFPFLFFIWYIVLFILEN